MAYSQTPILGLYDVDHLSEENTWDELADANFRRLEQAIHDRTWVELSGIDVTLNDAPYTGTQSHKKLLQFTGTIAASCSVIVPNKMRLYHVINYAIGAGGNAYTVTVKTAAGFGPALQNGEYAVVLCDSANCYALFRSSGYLTAGAAALTGAMNANSQRIYNVPWPGSDNADAAPINWVNYAINQTALAVKQALWPVGSLYFNAVNNTNPFYLLGFGTWVQYGGGTLVMCAGTHTDARGEYRNYSSAAEKPNAGMYQVPLTEATTGPHTHPIGGANGQGPAGGLIAAKGNTGNDGTTPSQNGGPVQYTASAGGGLPHENMPPFSVVYVWRRTA